MRGAAGAGGWGGTAPGQRDRGEGGGTAGGNQIRSVYCRILRFCVAPSVWHTQDVLCMRLAYPTTAPVMQWHEGGCGGEGEGGSAMKGKASKANGQTKRMRGSWAYPGNRIASRTTNSGEPFPPGVDLHTTIMWRGPWHSWGQ